MFVPCLQSSTAEQKAAAAKALWELARSVDKHDAIMRAGCILAPVSLAHKGCNTQRAHAKGTLMKLAENEACHNSTVGPGGIHVLLACVRDVDDG